MSRHPKILLFLLAAMAAGCGGSNAATHTVRVEAPGYRAWEGRVAVLAGTRVRVQATLQQEQE